MINHHAILARLHFSGAKSNCCLAKINCHQLKIGLRFYHASGPRLAEPLKLTAEELKERYLRNKALKQARDDYNQQRETYKAEVKRLRKEYMREVARHKAEDSAGKDKAQQDATRRRLERQRQKNIRSARNAILQEQIRLQKEKEFEEHLKKEQVKREARDDLYRRAHQLVIDELEKEAPLWLMTKEEVEAAFTPEAEQLLWSRPGGVLGAPNPSIDSHFWQHETHTWRMRKTYKLHREYLLEENLDHLYNEANIDKKFWTTERLEERIKLEEKARLRADVERVGRKELLRKQHQMIEEQYTEDGGIPKAKPPPDLKFLANKEALEKEGSRILLEDPTKFFIFDEDRQDEDPSFLQPNDVDQVGGTYEGPTLGSPVGLKKIGKNNFPLVIGKLAPPDTRTDREKKQEEREERLLAAAREKEAEAKSIDMAADDMLAEDLEPDADYDNFDWLDENDKQWLKGKGLDPDKPEDREIIEKTPPIQRFTQEDIEWVQDQIKIREEHDETLLRMEIETLQQAGLASIPREATEESRSTEQELEQLIFKLPYEQALALSDIDDEFLAKDGEMTMEEIAKAAQRIPDLTAEQLHSVLHRNREYKAKDVLTEAR